MSYKTLSNCCLASVRLGSGDERTNWYECTKCNKPCDIGDRKCNASTSPHSPNQTSMESIVKGFFDKHMKEISRLNILLSEKDREIENLKKDKEIAFNVGVELQNKLSFVASELECFKEELIQLLAVNVRIECYKEPHDIKDAEERIKSLIKSVNNVVKGNQ